MEAIISQASQSESPDPTRMSSTQAQNEFGRLVDTVLGGERILITRHDVPKAVLLSFEDYQALAGRSVVDLTALTARFDTLLASMQAPGQADRMLGAFRAGAEDVSAAAMTEATKPHAE